MWEWEFKGLFQCLKVKTGERVRKKIERGENDTNKSKRLKNKDRGGRAARPNEIKIYKTSGKKKNVNGYVVKR